MEECYTLIVALAVVVVTLLFYSCFKQREPIFGIYTQPSRWYPIKLLVFLAMYYYRRWYQPRRHYAYNPPNAHRYTYHQHSNKNLRTDPKAIDNNVRVGQGVKAFQKDDDMDKAQDLSEHPKAFDAVFFIGTNQEGYYMAIGCERRQMGMCNGLFYLVIPGKGLLCSKKLPDTVLFEAEPGQFGAEGLLMKPEEPMKKWTITFNGQMWYQSDPSKLVDVNLLAKWTAEWKYFDYDSDLYPLAVARSIAREPWSSYYFENLKRAHQSHYEQFGTMKVTFTLENESHEVKLQSFRDHSFGHKRDWSLMHRYAFHHLFLENGWCAAVGVICQPATATEFEAGVVCLANGEVLPLKWCDLKLYQHGENGNSPRDYAFRFKAGSEVYTVQVEVEHEAVHFVSSDWEARMVERFVRCSVNGVPGRGVSEFHYRHKGGRPTQAGDPQWFTQQQRAPKTAHV